MAQFNWAYINCSDFENSGSEGPAYSLQFVTESGGATTGSAFLTYYTASTYSYAPSTMVLSGNLVITGGISASYYHIEDIAIIDATGSTYFGDDQTDIHARTGSLEMYNDSSLIFKVDALTSDVGIRTTPSAPLHVYKAATTSVETVEMMRLQVADEGVDMEIGSGPGIDFYVGETGGSNYGGTVAVVREEAADADSSAAMAFHTAEDDQTPAAAREKMRITSTGKVGIGTTSPTSLLTVDGTISGSGQTTFGANMLMSGDQYVGGDLDVSGTVTFAGTTITLAGVAAGTDDTVLVYNGSTIVTDEIDNRVWGNTLVDATNGTDNEIAIFTDANSVEGDTNLTWDGSQLTIGGAISGSGQTTLGANLLMSGDQYVGGALNASGTVFVAQKIEHAGDTDTYIEFTADSVAVVAGAEEMILALEGGGGAQADKVTINNGATDVDFQVKGSSVLAPNLLRTDAANNRVGIGHPTGDLSGSAILSVIGAISGSSTLEAVGATILGSTLNVSGASTLGGSVLPTLDNTYDLGSLAKRWANVYTGDLHLKNERGDWTVIEEEEYLTLRNNKTGKRYKLAMEEID